MYLNIPGATFSVGELKTGSIGIVIVIVVVSPAVLDSDVKITATVPHVNEQTEGLTDFHDTADRGGLI